jgi:Flp pilus assembly protein TadD
MKLHHLAGVGLAALLAIGSLQVVAIADSRHDARLEKKAAGAARTASKAIAKKRWDKAIAAAEEAVALAPEDAGYRIILGSAYLKAGRFASAETAYRDALTLQPEDGRVALNLALAQIATGKWAEARAVLDRHAGAIPSSDRGLALALAGDPAAAVTLLTAATRTAAADAKTRQNLALAMALSGEWQQARTLVGLDLAPAEADKRIMEWAAFAHPKAASDQVAALLGVTPVTDPGQPVSLALAASVPVGAAAAPVDAFMPGAPAPEVVAAAVEPSPRGPVEVAVAPAPAPIPFVSVAAPKKVATGARAALLTAPIPYKTAIVGARVRKPAAAPMLAAQVPAKGDWVVQLGAFENAAVARDGWKRATRRFAALSGHQPGGMNTSVNGASFYRLSVGGFARADALAGDRLAAWSQARGVQVAMR